MIRRKFTHSRATLLAAWFVFAASLAPSLAFADDYPSRPVKLVVAFAPGGPADIVGRLVGQALQEKLGQGVPVENRAGAGGNVAAQYVSHAAPDGYTLFVTTSALAVNQTLYKAPGFDALKDFTPIALVAVSPNILVAPPSEPANDLKSFLERYKGKSLNYGSAGVGSTPHLTADQVLRVLGGLDVVHIPYKGASPALLAAASNEVPIASLALPPAVSMVKSGKVKALAVTSLKRTPALPDVPTVAEAGFAGFEDYTWVGLFAPAGIAPAQVARLNAIVVDALKRPDMLERLAVAGLEAKPGTPADFDSYFKREVVKWGKIVKDTGVEAQ